jgi:probable rRNA maturation factor
MIKVNVTKQSNFPVKSSLIKKRLREFLTKEGIVSDCVVSVAIVGEAKMLEISKKHLKDPPSGEAGKVLHNVLSFTESEIKGSFRYPPDGKIYLGEIIICYPKVVEEAKEEGVLIDKKACELIEHGALHLLGKHHE